MSGEAYTLNTKGLDSLLKAMKTNLSRARVGVLGGKDARQEPGETNASIGYEHEFGTEGKPMRSFLRTPIIDNLQTKMESSGAFDEDTLKMVIKQKDFTPWLQLVAKLAESIVGEGFDTGGFGKWAPWKTKGYTNNTGMLLVDTQQLRNSITSEVK